MGCGPPAWGDRAIAVGEGTGMRIKQIELNGFKSFLERTVLELPPGVSLSAPELSREAHEALDRVEHAG